jgi:hypothetical protein
MKRIIKSYKSQETILRPKEKDQMTKKINNDLHNTTHKTKD